MSTKKILYRTTSIGISGTFSAKIRIANLTDGGAKEYKHPTKRTVTHLEENHRRIVATIARVPVGAVELLSSGDSGHYFLVTVEDES